MTSRATTPGIAAHEEETLAQGHFGENYKDRSDLGEETRLREETTTVVTDRLFAKVHRIEMQMSAVTVINPDQDTRGMGLQEVEVTTIDRLTRC